MFLSGCGVTPGGAIGIPRRVRCTIPEPPAAYRDQIEAWRLAWWDGARVRITEASAPPSGSVAVHLEVAPGGAEAIVVSATAVSTAGTLLRPLGGWAVAPSTEVSVDPALGGAATVLLQLAGRGLNPGLVNLRRLAMTVRDELAADRDDPPPVIDRPRLAAALAGGEMTRYAVRAVPRDRSEIVREGSGAVTDWITDDMREPLIRGVGTDGQHHWAVPVAAGEVRHLWQATTGIRMTVGRDGDGHLWWFVTAD